MAASMKLNDCQNVDVIVNVVKHVTQVLLKGEKPPDDTIMHNLLDSVKQNVLSPEDVFKMELDVFVERIVDNSEQYDEGIVSFSINICGWLVEEEAFYCSFADKIKKIFSKISSRVHSGKVLETVILTSFYESLIPLTKHSQGLKWLVEECKVVIFDGLKLLISSPSIFLEKAIIEFVCTVIIQLECSVECVPIIDVIQQYLDKLLKQNTSRQFVAAPLKLLENLFVQYPSFQKELLVIHSGTFSALFSLLTHTDNKNSEAVLRIIQKVFRACSRRQFDEDTCTMDDFISKTDTSLTMLITNGEIVKAHKLALCCLELDKECVLYEKCSTLLCQPLYWMFGQVKGQLLIPEQTLIAALNQRTVCVSLVCLSLESSILPVDVVIRILRNTLTVEEMSISCAASYLLNNGKIQRKCLECLLRISTDSDRVFLENSVMSSACRCLLGLYKNAECDSSVSTLCTQLLTGLFPQLFSDNDYSCLTSELAEIIQRHLSALKWELRDSSLEFLGNVIQKFEDNSSIVVWLQLNRFPNLIWLSIKDGESYVRASAIAALFGVTQCLQLYQDWMETASLTEDDVVQEITHIINTDTEAFARRSAMNFLCQYYKVKMTTSGAPLVETIPRNVIATIVTALKDFDWEVKNSGLDFVNILFTCPISNQPVLPDSEQSSCKDEHRQLAGSTLSYLVDVLCYQNLAKVLMEVLNDYDDTVCEKSLIVFGEVQSFFKNLVEDLDRPSFENELRKCYREVECCCHKTGVNGSGETESNSMSGCPDPKPHDTTGPTASAHKCDCGIHEEQYVIETVDKILDKDLNVYKNRLKYSHDKIAKLVSLAEDIVSFTSNDDEEKISDCY